MTTLMMSLFTFWTRTVSRTHIFNGRTELKKKIGVGFTFFTQKMLVNLQRFAK